MSFDVAESHRWPPAALSYMARALLPSLAHHLSDTASIVAIGLVDLSFGLPRQNYHLALQYYWHPLWASCHDLPRFEIAQSKAQRTGATNSMQPAFSA